MGESSNHRKIVPIEGGLHQILRILPVGGDADLKASGWRQRYERQRICACWRAKNLERKKNFLGVIISDVSGEFENSANKSFVEMSVIG
jgi:hypothetical protein